MQRTFVIGKATPKPLGLNNKPIAAVQPKPVLNQMHAGCYAVVTKGLAAKMQGFKYTGSTSGTVYCVKATHAQCVAYQRANKLCLLTSIVAI